MLCLIIGVAAAAAQRNEGDEAPCIDKGGGCLEATFYNECSKVKIAEQCQRSCGMCAEKATEWLPALQSLVKEGSVAQLADGDSTWDHPSAPTDPRVLTELATAVLAASPSKTNAAPGSGSGLPPILTPERPRAGAFAASDRSRRLGRVKYVPLTQPLHLRGRCCARGYSAVWEREVPHRLVVAVVDGFLCDAESVRSLALRGGWARLGRGVAPASHAPVPAATAQLLAECAEPFAELFNRSYAQALAPSRMPQTRMRVEHECEQRPE